MDFIEEFLEDNDKKFRSTLLIDSGNISNLLSRGAVDIFDINYMLADANDRLKKAKFKLDQKEYQLTKSLLSKFKSDFGDNPKIKKPNNDEIKRKVYTHSLYIEELERLMEAEKVVEFLKVKQAALKERNDLLKTLANYKATEMRTLKLTKETK